ncbi:MAG: Uma2 family endonuclease [Planctomycetota bacterium]
MSVTTAKFSLAQYEHMVACGAFGHPHQMRVELLNGEIVEMSPIGYEHADVVAILVDWATRGMDRSRLMVRPQSPIRLPDSRSAPEPDVAVVKRQSYRTQHPGPDEVLLVIEVADSSLGYDRGEKLAAYAAAGIPGYWVVNLVDRRLEVYREPAGQAYGVKTVHAAGELAPAPQAAPDVGFEVAALFG